MEEKGLRLKGWMEEIFIGGKVYGRKKWKEEISIWGKLIPIYETLIEVGRIRGGTNMFRGRILCGEEKGIRKEIGYAEGMRLMEEKTGIPKPYLDLLLMGLRNLGRDWEGTIIKVENLRSEIEIRKNEVIFRFKGDNL